MFCHELIFNLSHTLHHNKSLKEADLDFTKVLIKNVFFFLMYIKFLNSLPYKASMFDLVSLLTSIAPQQRSQTCGPRNDPFEPLSLRPLLYKLYLAGESNFYFVLTVAAWDFVHVVFSHICFSHDDL